MYKNNALKCNLSSFYEKKNVNQHSLIFVNFYLKSDSTIKSLLLEL